MDKIDRLKFWLALNAIPGLGARRAKLLLKHFGSPQAILAAPSSKLRGIPGIGPELTKRIINWKTYLDLDKEFCLLEKHQVKVIVVDDSSYPKNLINIFDPPLILYIKGELLPRDWISVAIVGSRRSSFYGRRTAEKLGRELAARGLTVVSGLARGVDSAAHKGALSGAGRTIAVLGSGLDVVYPPENKELMEEISRKGAVVSEFPMSTFPERGNFPRRNRIISGLSLGVVVVEAAQRSGALITVDCALEQGREVFALPGKVDSLTSRGTNILIQQGAKLVTTSEDIIEELEPIWEKLYPEKEMRNTDNLPLPPLKEEEMKVYNLLSDEPKQVDSLIGESGLLPGHISSVLLMLQMKKLIKELPGKKYIKA
ncbi:MAG: DNA-protecting protein DprA [Nitrospirae bacterium]|nr:DNA-protecting protein DprA [Nitrospirota bacterium]